jgi:hypothetical protein
MFEKQIESRNHQATGEYRKIQLETTKSELKKKKNQYINDALPQSVSDIFDNSTREIYQVRLKLNLLQINIVLMYMRKINREISEKWEIYFNEIV